VGEIFRGYSRVGNVFQNGKKEVEAGGANDLGVRGDRRGERNIEQIVIDGSEPGGILDSREVDVEILDVETIEGFDTTARDIDED
jgi:hypothetical protein